MLGHMERIRSFIRRALGPSDAVSAPHLQSPSAVPFVAIMTIDRAWGNHPDVPRVFREFGLPSCSNCTVRFEETLGEAAAAYGVPLDDLLAALNGLTP